MQQAVHQQILGAPAELYLWLAVIMVVSFVLGRTGFGRHAYAIGNNARASYLAGISVRFTTVMLYALSGLFSALAGILLRRLRRPGLAGHGHTYLFQSIAAVVIGGVYILGGRGSYLGAAAGAASLTALVSVLLALDMPEYGRSIIYGVVILVLLLLYGREERNAEREPRGFAAAPACHDLISAAMGMRQGAAISKAWRSRLRWQARASGGKRRPRHARAGAGRAPRPAWCHGARPVFLRGHTTTALFFAGPASRFPVAGPSDALPYIGRR